MFFNFIYARGSTDVFAAENTFNRATRVVKHLYNRIATLMVKVNVLLKCR